MSITTKSDCPRVELSLEAHGEPGHTESKLCLHEQVIVLLAEAKKSNFSSGGENREGWIEHKSRNIIKKERKKESKTPKKRRFSSSTNSNEGCWICGKRRYLILGNCNIL